MAVFILYLSITGIALNHSHDWALNQLSVQNNWLLDIYGIKHPKQITQFELTSGQVVVQVDDKRWLNHHLLKGHWSPLIGAIKTNDYIVLASKLTLRLYSPKGQLIDELDASLGLPTPIKAISTNGQNVWIKTGNQIFMSDAQLLHWQPQIPDQAFAWSQPDTLNSQTLSRYQQRYRQQLLSWEKVLQDLHSGRIVSEIGKYILDLGGLLMICLSLTGLYLWGRPLMKTRNQN
jgi:hypothetical protein